MRIALITLCYNEMEILPWAVDYWKEFADKVVVYDNESTDGSIEFLRQFPWVDLKTYHTEGMNDLVVTAIKNNAWKQYADYDWIVVCDMDEMLYAKDGVRNVLESYNASSAGIIYPQWYALVSDNVPLYNGELLHRIRPLWCPLPNEAKPLIINPRLVEDTNFSAGQHYCSPIYKGEGKEVRDGSIVCLHTEKRLSPEYYIAKMKECQARRSDINLKMGYGYHYNRPVEMMVEELERYKNNAVRLEI